MYGPSDSDIFWGCALYSSAFAIVITGLLLFILKLTGAISWSWWYVTMPESIPVTIAALICLAISIFGDWKAI